MGTCVNEELVVLVLILSGEFYKGSYCELRPMKGQSKVFCRQRWHVQFQELTEELECLVRMGWWMF